VNHFTLLACTEVGKEQSELPKFRDIRHAVAAKLRAGAKFMGIPMVDFC